MRELTSQAFGDSGASVADLHDALHVLGVGAAITDEERSAQRFGDGTREAVARLQARYGWSDLTPGEFDELCAARCNLLLSERGHLEITYAAEAAEALWERFQVAPPSAAAPTSDVAALSRIPINMEAWWTRPNNVRGGFFYEDGQGWRGPYDVPGPVKGSDKGGLAALSRKDDTMEVWWVGTDARIRGAFWYEHPTAPVWKPYGNPVDSAAASPDTGIAAVSRTAKDMEIWWVGANGGTVRGAWWKEGGAPNWNPYSMPFPVNASPSSGLAAVSRFDNNMEVWWIGKNGSVEGAFWYPDTNWRKYGKQVAPDGSVARQSHNLTAVSRTQKSMDLLWITPGGDVRWAYWNDGDEWQVHPDKVADGASTTSGIAAITRSDDTMDVFWIATDGTVQGASWREGAGWRRHDDPIADNASPDSGIAATSRTATTTEVFWVSTSGSVEVAVRNDENKPFSFRMLRPHDLLDLRCEAFGCRIVKGVGAAPAQQHRVKRGETLSGIAQRYYGDATRFTLIAAANNLSDPDLIRPGDVLIIPPRPAPPEPPDTYTVVPGDRLWDIAKRFYGDGNKYRLIADANHLADPDLIVAGQKLIIPRLSRPSGQSKLIAVTENAHIIVHFGVQNLFEKAFPVPPGTASGVAPTRAADESRVVFAVPKKTEMAFSVPGVLAGLTRLGLRTVPLAVPKVTTADPRPDDAREAPVAPRDDETAIEAPYRLVVSPDRKYGGFMHSAEAAHAPSDPSRVELWHSRLAVRTYDTQGRFVGIDESDARLRTVRAIWERDGEQQPDDPAFDGSLSRTARRAIVRQTANPKEKDRDTDELIEPEPLTVDRLYLSALGAWVDWRGAWNFGRYRPDGNAPALEAYRHLATVGRDHYVREEWPIYLFPCGQRATLVFLTERKIPFDRNAAAYLFKRAFIVLREQVRDYTDDQLKDVPGDMQNHPAVNRLPFTATRVEPVVSPDLDAPPGVPPTAPFVPMVGGRPYLWKVTGTDHAGRRIPMVTALLAVPAGTNAYQSAWEKWWTDVVNNGTRPHPIELGGAEVAFAPSVRAGDTTLRTQSVELHGEAGPFTSVPFVHQAHVTIPAVAALNRGGGTVAVKWKPKYRHKGFTAEDRGQVFLILGQEAKLDFAGASDRGGGFIEPTVSVRALSRVLGAVGDSGSGTEGIEGGNYDPAKFSGTALPRLFGLLDLKDILDKGVFSEAPKVVTEQFDFVTSVETESSALTAALQRARAILDADRQTDAPLGAKMRFLELRNLADSALQDLTGAPVPQLVAALRQMPPPAGVAVLAGQVKQVLDNRVKPLATSPFLAAYLRAVIERPYRALTAALSVAADPTSLGKALLAPALYNTIRYEWLPKIKPWPATDAIFVPNDMSRGLTIAVEVRTDNDGKPQSDVTAQLRNFDLQLLPGDLELIRMKFGRIGFRVATGGKPEVDVQFNGMEFRGLLGFIEKLRQIIPFDGFSDPPYVDVDATSATAGFDLALPSVAIGVFTLENIALGADCRVPFLGEAVTVGFYFCTKEAPFRLTVMAIGGGGWVGIRLAPRGLVLLEMGLEAGASLSVDLVVASGSVSVMIGVYLRLEDKKGQLTGYFRIRGEVEVLGIASASITLELSLTYHFQSGKLIGRASLQVEIEVAFFSASVEITCERKLAGSRGDPSLKDIMPPDRGGQDMWNQYFSSFAITGA